MRLLITLLCLLALFGCAATQQDRASKVSDKPDLVPSDIDLVRHFLDSLYRSGDTSYRVIPDAESEESTGHIPLAKRNQDLSNRINQLRHAPSRFITVNLQSGDRPEPWGSGLFLYSYDTKTGDLAFERPHKIGDNASDMWIDVRQWPNGTQVVSLTHTWADDFKDNIFHLRKGERTFRFATAIEPLID